MSDDLNERAVIDEFEAKFKALGDEAKAAGVDWLVTLIYEDRFADVSLSTCIFSMPIHARIGVGETIKDRALHGVPDK